MAQGSLPSQQEMEVDLRRQLNDVFGEFDDFAGLVSKQIFGVIPTSGVMRGLTPYSANRLPSNAILPSASHCLQEMKNVAPLIPPLQVNRNDIENAGCASEASSSQSHMNDDENSIRPNKRKREQNDEESDGHVKRREHKGDTKYMRDLFDDDNEDERDEREWPRQGIKTLLDKMKVLPLIPPIETDKRVKKKEDDDEREEGEKKRRKEKDELERWKKDRNGDEERKHRKDEDDEKKKKKKEEEEDKRKKREEDEHRRRREDDEKRRKREDEEKEKEKKRKRKEESEREEEERRIRKEKKKKEKEDRRRKEEEEEKERTKKAEEREKQKKEEEAERKRLEEEELRRQKEIRDQEMARKIEEERRETERIRLEEEEKKKKETERIIREEEIRKKEEDERKKKEEDDRLKKEKKKEEEKRRKKEEEKEKRKKEEVEKAKKEKEKDKEIRKKGSLPLNGLSLSRLEHLKEKEKERKRSDSVLSDSKDENIGSIALLNEKKKKKDLKEEKPKEKRMKDVERVVKKEVPSARSSPMSSKNSSRVATPIPSQYLPSTSTQQHGHVGVSRVPSPSSEALSFPHCPSSRCMAAALIPTSPSHLEERPNFENYTSYAKEKKHKGDASTDKVIRYLNYMESSVYFALSVSTFLPSILGEKELNLASCVLKDTIDLIKHALVLIEKDGNTHMTSRAKILCIRIQSILNYHLYFFKSRKFPRRGEALASLESQVQEVMRDSPKKEEKKSAEKGERGGASVTPSSSSQSSTSNMVSMPMSLWKMKTTQVSTYGHLEVAHILWNDSVKMVTCNEKHYFNIMDNLILQSFEWGCPLSVGSSLLHLSHFTNTVITWLRQEYEAEKRKAD